MAPYILPLDSADPEFYFSALQALPYSMWLDSSDTAHPGGRYSFIAALPVETIEAQSGRITITNAHQQTRLHGDLISLLRGRLQAWGMGSCGSAPGLPPFQGGLAGFLGYEAAAFMAPVAPCAATVIARDNAGDAPPDAAIGIYDQVMAFDHQADKGWLITHAKDEAEAHLKQSHFMRMVESGRGFIARENPSVSWHAHETRESYLRKIAAVIDFIRQGDIFQANLTQRFEAHLPPGFDAFAHYLHLRRVNPAPFGGFMNAGRLLIASASPERFLRLQGGDLQTAPIKGTAARHKNDPAQDEAAARALAASEKDRAENIMIVDLLRNDFSRICDAASVNVTDLCRVESFDRVHHLVSGITGRLRDGLDALDALEACFPGGSITGAPKIRAMEIIAAQEGAPRGPYCGSFFYAGFDGAMDSNILIRTLVYHGRRATLQAGGGITLSSDPAAEYDESMLKAASILQSFSAPAAQKIAGAA